MQHQKSCPCVVILELLDLKPPVCLIGLTLPILKKDSLGFGTNRQKLTCVDEPKLVCQDHSEWRAVDSAGTDRKGSKVVVP